MDIIITLIPVDSKTWITDDTAITNGSEMFQ